MNDNAEIERALTAWMREEGPEREPPGLVERVVSISARRRPRLAAIALLSRTHLNVRTSRQGDLRQWKERIVFNYARAIATVAIIAIVAVLGWGIFRGPPAPEVGGPSIVPSVHPTAAPSAQASPVPVAAAGPLAAGRYAAGSFSVGLRYTLPESWGLIDDEPSLYVLQRFPPEGGPHSEANGGVYCPDTQSDDDWGASCTNSTSQIVIQLNPVLATNARDCEGVAAAGAPTSVDGMMAALSADQRLAVSGQEIVTIGGFTGRAFDVKLAPSWTATCKWSNGKPAGLIFTVAQPPGPVFGISSEELEHVIMLDLGDQTVSIGFRQGWRFEAEPIVTTFEFGR